MAPCPNSPNCVFTRAADPRHQIEPIQYLGEPEETMRNLKEAVQMISGSKIVEIDGHYLRAEFRTPVFRFVDDAEFLIIEEPKLIEFRSASRIGYHDLGVNRRRMERLRRLFKDICNKFNL